MSKTDDQDILVIGVAGGTASGKTTIAKRLQEYLGPDNCLLLSHDRYYYDVLDPESFNYDHPDSLDTALLAENIAALRIGEAAALPDYDFPTHTRKTEPEWVLPRPVILVEGILVLESQELRDLMDIKVWVDCPDDLRLTRRIRRDVATRGRNLEGVLNRWLRTVRPMHQRFVAPSASFADLELIGVGLLEPLVQSVVASIERKRFELSENDETAEWDGVGETFSGVLTDPDEAL